MRGHRLQRGVVAGGQPHHPQPQREELPGGALEPAQLAILLAETLDDPDPGDGRLDDAGQVTGLLLGRPVRGKGRRRAADRDAPEGRADRERDQGQQRREHQP